MSSGREQQSALPEAAAAVVAVRGKRGKKRAREDEDDGRPQPVLDVEPKPMSQHQILKKKKKNRIKRQKAREAKLRKREAAKKEAEKRNAEHIANEQRKLRRQQEYLERKNRQEHGGRSGSSGGWRSGGAALDFRVAKESKLHAPIIHFLLACWRRAKRK